MRKTKTVGFHIKLLEHFTYLMYGHARIAPINGVPDTDWKKYWRGKGCVSTQQVYFSRIPFCKNSLAPHIARIYVYIYSSQEHGT